MLDETYTYQVDQISVVLPSDISKLNIESGKDYATLITCTPYGVNSHRLLVRGHRIPNPKVPDATTYDEPGYMTAVAALVIGLLVSIIGFACVWLARLWRRGRIVKADRVAAGATRPADGRSFSSSFSYSAGLATLRCAGMYYRNYRNYRKMKKVRW